MKISELTVGHIKTKVSLMQGTSVFSITIQVENSSTANVPHNALYQNPQIIRLP